MRQTFRVADEQFLRIRSLEMNFPPGSQTGWHSHGWPQFVYSASGALRAEVEQCDSAESSVTRLLVPPGRGLWLGSGIKHKLMMLGNVKLRTLYCRVDAFADEPLQVLRVGGLLRELILRVCSLGALDVRVPEQRRLADVLVTELSTALRGRTALRWPRDSRAFALSECLLDGDGSDSTLENLCTEVGLSRRTAERLFVAETGLSPGRWRREALLERSVVELLEGKPIGHAAISAGFQSSSAYAAACRRSFGLTPTELRQGVLPKDKEG